MFEYVIESDGTERICRLDPVPTIDTIGTVFSTERYPYDDVSDVIVYHVQHQGNTLVIKNRNDLCRIDKFIRKGSINYLPETIDPILQKSTLSPQERLFIQEACDYCFCYPLSAKASKTEARLLKMREILSRKEDPVSTVVITPQENDLDSVDVSHELDFGF